MSAFRGVLATVTFGGLWTVVLASWVAVVVYGFKAVRQPRPGVRLWGRTTLWNPANALLRPDLLTEQGQSYRSRCLRALLVFGACVGSMLFIGAVTGTLK